MRTTNRRNVVTATLCVLSVVMTAGPALAANTLDQGIRHALNSLCPVPSPAPPPGTLGPNLEQYCIDRSTTSGSRGGPEGAAGAASRQSKDSKVFAEAVGERLRERQGAEASSAASLFDDGRLGMFLSTEFEFYDKDVTTFEPGFESNGNSALIGVDYRLTGSLLLGVAGGIRRVEGDYADSGGSFDAEQYEVFLYGSYRPGEALQLDLSLGYGHYDFATNRRSAFIDPDAVELLYEDAFAAGDSEADEYQAVLRASYLLQAGSSAWVPSIGIDYRRTRLDPFAERGEAALRLAHGSRTDESLTSVIGLAWSASTSQSWGVLQPQLGFEWVHEYRRDVKDIRARFAEDLTDTPVAVVYASEAPDRDYYHLDLGISAVLPHGLQPYFNFRAMLGHDYYRDYIMTLGIRGEL